MPGMRPSGRIPEQTVVAHVESAPERLEDDVGSTSMSVAEDAQRRVLDRLTVVYGLGTEAIAQIVRLHKTLGIGVAAAARGLGYAEVADVEWETAQEFPIAVVEAVRVRPGPQLLIAHDSAHPHSERVRLLRTELLLRHMAREEGAAVAVLSASAGEGRSLLAAELALAFAQLERPTLLLDADMRSPMQHTLFGTQLGNGLAQAITNGGRPTFLEVEGSPALSILTAGVCPPNPLELLSDGRFDSLMTELRNSFEFIIVDTPRFSDYADGLAIATVVGHVLTVHRARRTQYKVARNMLRQLASARADILGGVINHF